MTAGLWDRETFVEKLREIGGCAYHDRHPFHVAMNEGRLSPEAVRGWVANRFYYQRSIPLKDAAILSNCPLADVRRVWIHRIADHDGTAKNEGGIEAWLRLGEACGLSRDELIQDRNLQPGVRFAVDAYVNFARNQPWPVAIASSLTELFAPDLMAARLAAFEKFYPWVDPRGLDYFRRRVTQARRDSSEALEITIQHCSTPELQDGAVRALQFKCDVLWCMLDAIHHAYGDLKEGRSPVRPTTGKFRPPESRCSLLMGVTMISDHAQPRLAGGVRFEIDGTTGKGVLLFPEGILELNETAQEIIIRCDGRTLSEIVLGLGQEYEADPEILAADVRETLADLQRRKLVEFA